MTFDRNTVEGLAQLVVEERAFQHEKWGQQDWPSFRGEDARRQFERRAESWKQINDARDAAGELTWDGILLEEVYEALSETEPVRRMGELIQVAAVALAEVEAISRALVEFEEQDREPIEEEDEEDKEVAL